MSKKMSKKVHFLKIKINILYMPDLFFCEYCDIKTNRKSAWFKHCKTKKHNRNVDAQELGIYNTNTKDYICNICDKKFYDRSGLWKHMHKKKLCQQINNNIENNNTNNDKDTIKRLLEKNKLLLEQNNMLIIQNKSMLEKLLETNNL